MRQFDLLSVHARELGSLPADWEIYKWELIEPDGGGEPLYGVTGAVAPMMPRKKRRNWKKRDRETVRSFHILKSVHDAWVAVWLERTGNCPECYGDGRLFVRWVKGEGVTYCACKPCGGTGKKTVTETVDA